MGIRMVARFSVSLAMLVALAACETTNSDDWTEGDPNVPFNTAEDTCETQTNSIEDEEDRPEFFAMCMTALGWTPRPGTPYATPATAPDPT